MLTKLGRWCAWRRLRQFVEALGDNCQRARDEVAVFQPKQLGVISAPDNALEIGPIKVHCCVPFGTHPCAFETETMAILNACADGTHCRGRQCTRGTRASDTW